MSGSSSTTRIRVPTFVTGAGASAAEVAVAAAPVVPSVGMVKIKVEPFIGSLVTQILPPCFSTSDLTMLRPRPVPLTFWVAGFWARKNLVNSLSRSSAVMPTPVSLTSTCTSSSRACARTLTAPPSSVYLCALDSRLVMIWTTRSRSALTWGRSAGNSSFSDCLFCSISGRSDVATSSMQPARSTGCSAG